MPASPPAIFTPPGVPSPSAPGAVHAVASATPATPAVIHAPPSANPAAPGAVHVAPGVGGGNASLLVDPTGENNTFLVQAIEPGLAGAGLSFGIDWANDSGTSAWVWEDQIWVTIGSRSMGQVLLSYSLGMNGTRMAAADYAWRNSPLINGKGFYERLADAGIRILWNGSKWAINVDGADYYEQQAAYEPYAGGIFVPTTAGFLAGNGNCSLSFSISTSQQVIDAINSTSETSALISASAVGDVSGGCWVFDLTPLSISGYLTPPPAIHSAPARTPGTPPVITP